MLVLRPKNWAFFQHYKNRSPPWIRLHRSLLDNYEFQCLPVASRALAPMLWLLAAEAQDPDDPKFDASPNKMAFRLRMNEEDFIQSLKPLIEEGFFECLHDASNVLAGCKHDATPETETETEGEADSRGHSSLVGADAPPRLSVPFEKIVELYHEHLPTLPRVEKLTNTRKGNIRQRWLEDLPTLDHWTRYFRFVAKSDFLMGRAAATNGRPPFRADLEWLTKPSNFAKVAEDKYHGVTT